MKSKLSRSVLIGIGVAWVASLGLWLAIFLPNFITGTQLPGTIFWGSVIGIGLILINLCHTLGAYRNPHTKCTNSGE